ncbi:MULTISPECIES: hypothetical protein [Pseudomonas]|jgi:hypothetical protein|uniref:hypothetical protein n=1 Tax=Pseudomonas TaxID=286 RepID=UPI00099B2EE4|nr:MULTISPECIES: hypothetical protein [Pseudomonas]MCK3836541.1 hypothetical protein [Pseudomonas sp. NCIMB 10586]MCK3845483.1 hypothetical protein [Pseudomonas sp. W15Feb34]MCK3863945.1 hypothetical protein [Pseudomonas sp. B329]OPB03177.1 hypothetical protein BFW89_14325 [Pseudomonas synxantha]VCU63298.1 hypothetical protein [Pseudomonas synxantha]
MSTFRWLTVLCLAASIPAYASSAFKPIELNDAQMADLRGRYVMPGRIISFGIVMSSTWTNAVGDRITGTANMQIDKTTVTPQFYVQTTGSTGNGSLPNTGTGNVVGGAGLGSGQGVTQSVRTAGDGNTAYNDVGISIENGVAPASNLQTGQVLMAGGTVTGDSAAGRVSVSANNGGVQMAIQANHNQGNSLQQIGGGNVLQGTVLTGNSNLVRNITQLNVVMNNNGLNNGALNCNLDQLKGLRTLGY